MLRVIVFCIAITIIVITILVYSYNDMMKACEDKGGILVKSSDGTVCIDRKVIIE